MLVRVRFFGGLKETMKKSWMLIEVPKGSTIRDFFFQLAKNKDSALLEKFMADKNKIRSEITVLLNGRNIMHLKGLETELKDRDLISILPIVGGG